MTDQPSISELHFADAPSVSTRIPGPKSRRLLDEQSAVESAAVSYPGAIPIAIDAAKGATLRDVDGNTFLDFFAGMGALNVGHSNPYVLEAVEAQLRKVTHTFDFPTEPRLELVEKLDEIAPSGLAGHSKVLFGGPTGSDAIEASIKLAKQHTGGDGLIAFRGSYHGQSAGALSLTAGRQFKRDYTPLLPDVTHVPFPHPTRHPDGFDAEFGNAICPVDAGECCQDAWCAIVLENVRELLADPYSGLANPAGICVEPVQATGGIVFPPPGFLAGLQELCAEHDVAFIVDEIQTGLGRTGEWFASDLYDVTPDIMPVSKSLGGVGLPLSATVYDERFDSWESSGHSGTFRGNVPAMAGGVRAIEYIQDHDLLSRTRSLGETVRSRLSELESAVPAIVDVRGEGLMWGLEFAPDEGGDRAGGADLVGAIQEAAYTNGVLVWTAGREGSVLRLMPPLVITETQLESGLDIIEDSILEHAG